MLHPPSPVRAYDASNPRRRERALEDLATGFARWRLAWALARGDITHRYRGSVLGPLWLTISTAVMLASLGFLYAKLFGMEVGDYLPWLAASLIIWGMIAQVTTDATACLTSVEGVIRQMPLPYTVHALRVVFRNAVIAAHNLPLIAVVFAIYGVAPGWGVLLALPGLLIIAVGGFASSFLLGMLCARFRDIPPIVGSVMQLAFFVSPVMWKPDMVGEWAPLMPLNPFFAVMETVRGPLMGGAGSLLVWVMAVIWTALLVAVSWALFVRFRGRIAFWV
ncbi:ABC transporter permease [Roseomonas eburnea]|uniref:ABC transporter permease n=1 Tax=Neoroseomonas eburnea TaxID=1346889 RepID=A0A9X9X743_9PROT|nr:ABC transporter permease [Neoroseomonas eburnea]MBR0679529.1 ABC transporter permease [Neoroseomonas eburnea]